MKNLLVICAALSVSWTQVHSSCIADGDRNPNGANVTKNSISEAILKYTLDQYKTMVAQDGSINLFTSPFSIWTALANAYLGSRGRSSAELAAVLGLGAFDKADVEHAMLGLAKNIVSETGDKFLVANKLAFNKVFRIRDCLIGDSFEVESMDFQNNAEKERKRINAWVMSKTEDKIKDLIPEGLIDTDTLLVILNAVYFKGSWENGFDENHTKQAPFYSQNGDTNNVDMMYRKGKTVLYTSQNEEFRAVDLPYTDGNYSMSILLPVGNNTVDSILSSMTPKSMMHMFGEFNSQDLKAVKLKLPKFKLESSYELKETLKSLGAARMFEHLDISGIMETTGGSPSVDAVLHKAFLSVNEGGTEAAAATAVIFVSRSGFFANNFSFIVNRPFITMIREVKTKTVMFVGIVRNL